MLEARLAALTARFGDRLSEDRRAALRRTLTTSLATGGRLRQTQLGNADEPDPVFVPFRGESG